MQALLEQARLPTWRLWARDAAIEMKDVLKARGYDKAAEVSWLRENVMGPDNAVWALRITARDRYSDRCWGWGEPFGSHWKALPIALEDARAV